MKNPLPDFSLFHCPSCNYYLAQTGAGTLHCYNCDEDIDRVEAIPHNPPPSEEDDDVAYQELFFNPAFRTDDDDEGEPAVFEAKITETDPASLAAALREGRAIDMVRVTDSVKDKTAPLFPYTLDDLLFWVIKKKTGEIVKYSLVPDPGISGYKGVKETKLIPASSSSASSSSTGTTKGLYSYSDWCKHDPKPDPVFEYCPKKEDVYPYMRLFIADALGMKNNKEKFDIVLDCGDVLSDLYATRGSGILVGAKGLADDPDLNKHILGLVGGPKVLKIAWNDRKAPPVEPAFWPALARKLEGDVLINCQGGHGRSGTALVCLMMVLNPEYGAADAITHLRAIHCARAIESWEQHDYIDAVAEYLKKESDAKVVHEIKNFREAFLALKHPSAKEYQARLTAQSK